MNLLLITFSFPPAGGVGVLRALSLAKYLPENDIRVDVLTARNAPAVEEMKLCFDRFRRMSRCIVPGHSIFLSGFANR